jgi:hypothetical protein
LLLLLLRGLVYLFLLLELGFALLEGGFCFFRTFPERVELGLIALQVPLKAWNLAFGLLKFFLGAFCPEGL